ncbi:GNAT family N-acetyltransferase [Persicitalea jodogahamensis]|uniref:Acetyltransferase n=1 Tax=Persicitalea jodogahamensis TaxID=402147 RepID=A0A8J3DBJ4_9BACT|nr:GNAT family N-acetyltransferase [Persicitalea jodogahamensis]GHB78702.1 acetyltransferase [Persicitalea jodogahamensis]
MNRSSYYADNHETERLRTRFLTSDDAEVWKEFFMDQEAVKFFPMAIFDSHEESSRHWIERQLTRYAKQQYGMQALIDKQSNAFVGMCGLMTQTVDDIVELEVGYHILKKYWGKGYAPEAARLFIGYAFAHNLSGSVVSIIDIENSNSQRVAEKNGLTREKQTQYMGLDVYLYRIFDKAFN